MYADVYSVRVNWNKPVVMHQSQGDTAWVMNYWLPGVQSFRVDWTCKLIHKKIIIKAEH